MSARPKLPDLIASRYLPVRLIGRGGMGAVYEVEHVRTGERLALKLLLSTVAQSSEALERFKREARASARIKSEHVVRVTDADVAPELDGAPFLVMELLEGMDLEQAASLARPSPATVVGWLGQVSGAIDKAHRQGIVHRDLKPENLFLSTEEDRPPLVKVLDFGIAKMAQEGAQATGSGQVLGTPKYMAPEQATGSAPIEPATDRYALGLIAYRLIVGEDYYRGKNVMGILAQILHDPLEPPSLRDPSLGAPFDAWFQKACHRDPKQRFSSATEQTEALADALRVPHSRLTDSREVAWERPSELVAPTQGFTRSVAATLGTARVRRIGAASAALLAGALGVALLPARSDPPATGVAPPASHAVPLPASSPPSAPAVDSSVAPPAMTATAAPSAAPRSPPAPRRAEPSARGKAAPPRAKATPLPALDPFGDQK